MAHTSFRQRLGKALLYVTLLLGSVFTVTPFLYMVSTSFKGQVYVFEFPPRFIPEHPSVDNFIRAWASNSFGLYFFNSLVVAIATTLIVVLLTSMMAYAFARFEFVGKNALFYAMLGMMMVPGLMLIIPQFILAGQLHLLNKLSGLVIVYAAGGMAFNTFLLRGFFEGLPRDLEEAVLLDGGGPWTIYTRVIIPLSTPALATVSIFAFLGAWDEYIWALTVINEARKRTLPIAIANFQGTHASDWGLIFAASLIAVTPVLVLYISLQRFFVEGLTSGAIKG